MGSAILIFAGPKDDVAFREYTRSIGLTLLHPHSHGMTTEENDRTFDNPIQGGYFSFLPIDRLSKHPHPDIGLCDAIDPLILYVRPHHVSPYLVAGQVIWNDDINELANQTKPYFQKLRRWVQKNWRRRDEDRYYIGPDAERILREEGAQIAYLPPNVKVETKWID